MPVHAVFFTHRLWHMGLLHVIVHFIMQPMCGPPHAACVALPRPAAPCPRRLRAVHRPTALPYRLPPAPDPCLSQANLWVRWESAEGSATGKSKTSSLRWRWDQKDFA